MWGASGGGKVSGTPLRSDSRNTNESARLKLQGLDEKASYTVTDLDTGKAQTLSGGELMQSGMPVTLKNQPESALLVYRRK